MENIIIIAIIAVILCMALAYLYKAKKSGAKCVGCPSGGCCSEKCTCGETKKKK